MNIDAYSILSLRFFCRIEKGVLFYLFFFQKIYGINLFSANRPGFFGIVVWVTMPQMNFLKTHYSQIPLANGGKEWQLDTLISMAIIASIVSVPMSIIIICSKRILSATRAIQLSTLRIFSSKSEILEPYPQRRKLCSSSCSSCSYGRPVCSR